MKTNRLTVVFLIFLASVASFAQAKKPVSEIGSLDAVKVNGINYYDIGDKKKKHAIVFVHGWTCNADFWKQNMKAFPSYRVLAIDLPGHGKSDKPRVSYTMKYFAEAVDTVMRNSGVEKAVLVGHSMGTPVTREFYRMYPERTLGIVIVDGALKSFFPKKVADEFIAQLKADYKGNSAKFVDGMLTPVKDESLKKYIRDTMLSAPDYVGISAFEGMADERIWRDDKVSVPVLAIMAPSPFWPPNVKEIFASIAPRIDFHAWTDVSHFLQMEKPGEFNAQVSAFIRNNKLL